MAAITVRYQLLLVHEGLRALIAIVVALGQVTSNVLQKRIFVSEGAMTDIADKL